MFVHYLQATVEKHGNRVFSSQSKVKSAVLNEAQNILSAVDSFLQLSNYSQQMFELSVHLYKQTRTC